MRSDLPSGTVTFLFTDVEGSTKLLHELGAEGYAEALTEHRLVIREACAAEGGVEVDTQGDAFFFAFLTAPSALAAAEEMTDALAAGPIRVRIGLHTGTPLLTEEGYVGGDVHRAARIAAAGHGGQVLVSSSTAQLVEIELADLGEHRFKDLGAPERVYQLGDGQFPALKSLYRTNLPVPTTPFLGRERELVEVVGLLEDTRLLTLTGPGGTGKTRLAAQAAGLASDSYLDGVWWVPLAALREPELVLDTAAQVVGSKNGLAEHIADKRLLLLFDNFEQVVEAASDLASLLASCPNLDLLVTSREPLHVTGEQEYPVPPLVHEEGVGFFLARARAIKPDFAVDDAVSEICRRLDELPLALELAAARVKALSSAQILQRLEQRMPLLTGGARDLPERQRTLRGAIEWSYELLNDDEQRLFARLSVFRGGCTLAAAEDVAAADLDTLQSLVDKSLLRFTNERFWMLETIRDYAAERMEESGEAEELRRRHAAWFLAFAEEVEPRALFGSAREKELVDRLEGEHDNVRAALDQLEVTCEGERALRLAGAMWPFWALRGHHAEGRRRLESALRGDDRSTAARARALTGAAVLLEGDSSGMRSRAEEALALYRELDDAWGTAHSVYMLGHAAGGEGNYERAQELWEESLRGFREIGDEHFAVISTDALAWVYNELGDRRRARALYEDNLRRARATSNRRMEAYARDALAMLAIGEERVPEAFSMLKESLSVYQDLDVHSEIAESLGLFAAAAAEAGRADTATRFLASSRAQFEELGGVPFWVAKRDEATLKRIHEQLDESAFVAAWDEGARLTLEAAVALALDESDADA
jgi:predicted ATPase/class 3 adenylate cyclase